MLIKCEQFLFKGMHINNVGIYCKSISQEFVRKCHSLLNCIQRHNATKQNTTRSISNKKISPEWQQIRKLIKVNKHNVVKHISMYERTHKSVEHVKEKGEIELI